jgi:glycerophosphoryl diester phosphodiesterase
MAQLGRWMRAAAFHERVASRKAGHGKSGYRCGGSSGDESMRGRSCAAVIALLLAGCGGSSAPGDQANGIASAATPTIIADAGDGNYAPEETMIGMRNAVRLGADVIEADANMTSDNVIVLIHDGTLDRTTDCTGNVKDQTFAAVEACDAAFWWVPGKAPGLLGLVGDPTRDPNDGQDYALRGKGVKIATAREFFEYAQSLGPRMPFTFIEIKNIPYDSNFDPLGHRIADVLVPLIQEFGLQDRVAVESFWPASLSRVRELDASIRTVFLTLGSAGENLLYVAATPTEYSSSDTLAPDYGAAYVNQVHALGRQATPWLVDTLADAQKARALGVDGVFTSHVACMLQGFGRPVPRPIVAPEAGVAYDVPAC